MEGELRDNIYDRIVSQVAKSLVKLIAKVADGFQDYILMSVLHHSSM